MDFATWDSLGNIPPSGVDGVDSGGFDYWDTLGNMPAWTVAETTALVTDNALLSALESSSVTLTETAAFDIAAARRKRRRMWWSSRTGRR